MNRFDLGDVVPITATVKDATGTLVDAGTVTCTITLPDGSTVTPTVAHPSIGVYTATYKPTIEGRFYALLSGAGGNDFGEPYWFVVNDGSKEFSTTAPIVDAFDLGVYLADPSIDYSRAAHLIDDAQALCESIIKPLPAPAAVIVKRVAGRAYMSFMSPRQAQIAGGSAGPGNTAAGVYLTQYDVADLRRFASGGGTFSVDLLPTGYVAPASWGYSTYFAGWDVPL